MGALGVLPRWRRRLVACASASSLMFAVAGGSTLDTTTGFAFANTTPTSTSTSGHLGVSCGVGPAFDVSIFNKPAVLLAESTDSEDRRIAEGISRLNADQQTVIGPYLRSPMRFIGTDTLPDGTRLRAYVIGDLPPTQVVTFNATTAMFRNGGICSLRASLDGNPALMWWLDPQAPKPNANTRQLRILVQDTPCGGGGATLLPRLTTWIDDTRASVSITIAATPLPTPPGVAYMCEGYPPNRITIRLPTKLGSRRLINASTYPATTAERYPVLGGLPPTVTAPKR